MMAFTESVEPHTPSRRPLQPPRQSHVDEEMLAASEQGQKDPPLAIFQLLFKADHKDAVLIAFYTAVLKIFAGSGQDSDPTRCTKAEHIVDWLTLGIVLFVYVARHFLIVQTRRPLWLRLGRCLLLLVFLLSTHSQPVACAIPSSHLSTLSYVQGSIMLVLALIATQVLAHSALQLRRPPGPPELVSHPESLPHNATVHANQATQHTDM